MKTKRTMIVPLALALLAVTSAGAQQTNEPYAAEVNWSLSGNAYQSSVYPPGGGGGLPGN